jgi:hypothetical protein
MSYMEPEPNRNEELYVLVFAIVIFALLLLSLKGGW